MKRFLLICMALVSTVAFACNGPLHEIIHEVETLHAEGYHFEARDLLMEISQMDICSFTAEELKCYNKEAQRLNFSEEKYICRKCYTEHFGYVSKCKNCGGTDLYIKPPTWMDL